MLTKEQRHNLTIGAIVLVIMLLLAFLGGCRPTHYIESTRNIEVHDTIIVTEPDTATMRALIECDSLGNIMVRELETLHTERANVNTVVEYRTQKVAEIKTEYLLQTDTIYVPTYRETVTKTRTIVPPEKPNLWFAWLLIGIIAGSIFTYKLFR